MSDTPDRTCYELLVGRHLSPATLATFPVALRPTVVPRNTVRRLRVGADSDIADIVRRLTERGVELLAIRRCSPEAPRPLEQRATWAVPPEQDSSGVVVRLPVSPAAGRALPEHRPGQDGGGSVVPLIRSGPADAGGGPAGRPGGARAGRRRGRPARG